MADPWPLLRLDSIFHQLAPAPAYWSLKTHPKLYALGEALAAREKQDRGSKKRNQCSKLTKVFVEALDKEMKEGKAYSESAVAGSVCMLLDYVLDNLVSRAVSEGVLDARDFDHVLVPTSEKEETN